MKQNQSKLTYLLCFLPRTVQQECIPQAVLGMDIICQAKSGMGKTAVFVLATLQQLVPTDGQVDTLVVCHTRELAYQICQEFIRFSKYMSDVKVKVFFGGIPISQHKKLLEAEQPHVAIGTPGRILALSKDKLLKLGSLKRFIVDECDQVLESLDMRKDVQAIFKLTPHEKQVMMFSATLSKEIRPVCRKFTQHVCITCTVYDRSEHSPKACYDHGSLLLHMKGINKFLAVQDICLHAL